MSDDTRLRFTTNERADVIDASGTATPVDASVPELFDTKGGNDTLIAGPLADIVSAGQRQRHHHRRAGPRTSCAATPATTASPA